MHRNEIHPKAADMGFLNFLFLHLQSACASANFEGFQLGRIVCGFLSQHYIISYSLQSKAETK
jgi:hypothetical protein